MAEFKINVDLSHLMRVGSAFTKDVFPHLALAVQTVADRVEARWKLYASGAPMPNGKTIGNRSGAYLRSIMQRNTGDFSRDVYTELPYAQAIESGAPRRDLKTMLNSSLKVRISAAGKRYLIIPFRHSPNPNNVMRDNAMPPQVVEWWKDKRASSIVRPGSKPDPLMSLFTNIEFAPEAKLGTHRLSGTGAYDIKTRMRLMVPEHHYDWGDRLSKATLAGLGVGGEAARRMQGMVNFRKPGKSGGAAHSQFITFRTMVEGSKGWIAPAQEGKWPARQVSEIYQPVAEKAFADAVAEDIRRVIPGAAPGP